jgi:hypothetical protein
MTVGSEESPVDVPKSDAKSTDKKHDAFEKATLATAIAGIIILCVYTGLTAYQACIAKDTAERQLRAYMSAAVEKQPDLDGPAPAEVTILYKNNGQTPAYRVQTRAVFSVGDSELSKEDIEGIRKDLKALRKSETVVFPGQEIRGATIPGVGIPLTEGDKITINLGARVLWLNGEITYLDAFGISRFTNFRLYFSGAQDTRMHKFVWADAGNEAN